MDSSKRDSMRPVPVCSALELEAVFIRIRSLPWDPNPNLPFPEISSGIPDTADPEANGPVHYERSSAGSRLLSLPVFMLVYM